MRRSNWTPSIAPNGNDETVYLVADDFGKIGRAWAEADYETADLETIIQDLLSGRYSKPIRVIAFNTAEQWSQDVSADVAQELRHRCDFQQRDIPFFLQDFCDSLRRALPQRPAAADAAGMSHGIPTQETGGKGLRSPRIASCPSRRTSTKRS
jgi:hypothetical protein